MKTKDFFLAIVEAILWLLVIYTFFYTIKNDVNLWLSSIIILVLSYSAAFACPLMRNSDAWRRTFKK